MCKPDAHGRAIGYLFLAAILIGMYLLARPAHSQATDPACTRNVVIEEIAKQDHMTPAIAGLTEGGSPVLIFSNPKTGNFIITVRRPGGITCVVTAGSDWTVLDQPKDGTDL